jgi:hypothetical protein
VREEGGGGKKVNELEGGVGFDDVDMIATGVRFGGRGVRALDVGVRGGGEKSNGEGAWPMSSEEVI